MKVESRFKVKMMWLGIGGGGSQAAICFLLHLDQLY